MNFLIWSYEHEAWWQPMSSGYTEDITKAGVYTAQDLADTCIDGYPSSLLIPQEMARLCGSPTTHPWDQHPSFERFKRKEDR